MKGTRKFGYVFQPTYLDKRTGEKKISHVWWIQYHVRGRPMRESSASTNLAVARRLLKLHHGEVAAGKPVTVDIERTRFEDLKEILLNEYKVNDRRSVARVESALRHLSAYFGEARARDITSDRVNAYIVDRREHGAANATVNRELAALKRAFRLAAKRTPPRVALVPDITLLDEDNTREGFLEQAEFTALHSALPEILKDPVLFLWQTGWRVGEMRSLQWQSVYSDAIRLRRENSKNKHGRELPLIGELAEIIERARATRRLDCPYVFHIDGRAIGSFRKTWATACRKAGVLGLLVHDLRRSAVRNLIRAGVSESVAMEITGHRTADVFKRYDITSSNDRADALGQVQQYLAQQPTEPKIVPLRRQA